MNFCALMLVLSTMGTAPAQAQDGPAEVEQAPASLEPGDAVVPAAVAVPEAAPAEAAPDEGAPKTAVPLNDGLQTEEELNQLRDRLLGDAPPPTTRTPIRNAKEMELPETPAWLWPVGLTLVALLAALRWQVGRVPPTTSKLRVSQRVMLGRDGNLAVVEVGTGSDRRRLLVGYGGGAPRLVAELDASEATPERETRDSGTSASRWRRALARAEGNPSEGSASPGGRSRGALRPRSTLIAEVLAERDSSEVSAPASEDAAGGEGRKPVSSSFASSSSDRSDPVDTNEDDGPSETYTFRGLIG